MNKISELTLMVYIAGDNDLWKDALKDIGEMRQVGSSKAVNLIAEFDNHSTGTATRYHIQRDGDQENTWPLGKVDSGAPETLRDFCQWASTQFPAEKYALILWSHGTGWRPEDFDRHDVDPPNTRERGSIAFRSSFFKSTIEQILVSPERATAFDNDTGHSIDTIELDRVLYELCKTLGQPLDLLGFDACLMSNLELIYQLKDKAKYLVASAYEEEGAGWSYDKILAFIHRQVEQTGKIHIKEVAKYIVHSFDESMKGLFSTRGYSKPYTIAALDLAKIDTILSPLSRLSTALINAPTPQLKHIWNVAHRTVRYDNDLYLYDLANIAHKISNYWLTKLRVDNDIRQHADALYKAFSEHENNFVIKRSAQEPKFKDTGGVSIYFMHPGNSRAELSSSYACLGFSREQSWLAMLNRYASLE